MSLRSRALAANAASAIVPIDNADRHPDFAGLPRPTRDSLGVHGFECRDLRWHGYLRHGTWTLASYFGHACYAATSGADTAHADTRCGGVGARLGHRVVNRRVQPAGLLRCAVQADNDRSRYGGR